MNCGERPLVGEFRELLEDFIGHKKNLGYKYDATREKLTSFSKFTLNYRIENRILNKQVVTDWTSKRKNESITGWKHRNSDLRQFAIYLQNLGHDVFIPPRCRRNTLRGYIPYIFTHEEIVRFLRAVDSMRQHPLSNQHMSCPLLFRLLYCCGLRISEAINLKISDVDFENGVLLIKNSKFGKDRLIPVSAPLADMFVRYHTLFNRNHVPQDYFFRNKKGTPLHKKTVYKIYRDLLWKAGISHGGKGIGPRLHDFRYPNLNKIQTFLIIG